MTIYDKVKESILNGDFDFSANIDDQLSILAVYDATSGELLWTSTDKTVGDVIYMADKLRAGEDFFLPYPPVKDAILIGEIDLRM